MSETHMVPTFDLIPFITFTFGLVEAFSWQSSLPGMFASFIGFSQVRPSNGWLKQNLYPLYRDQSSHVLHETTGYCPILCLFLIDSLSANTFYFWHEASNRSLKIGNITSSKKTIGWRCLVWALSFYPKEKWEWGSSNWNINHAPLLSKVNVNQGQSAD